MSNPKRIWIRKDVKSRIWIPNYLNVRSGSVIDWKVGSGSKLIVLDPQHFIQECL